MKPIKNARVLAKIRFSSFAVAILALLTGCKEANLAIDFILGTRTPTFMASHPILPFSMISSKKRTIISKALPETHEATQVETRPSVDAEHGGNRNRLEPNEIPPQDRQTGKPGEYSQREIYPRDPFRPPTEDRPSECPPSMPLCRFDPSQLTLRGLIQVDDGQFKGMVEDPDGRGYFITPGMQISGATVTQVTSKGIILYLHKSKKIEEITMK